MKRKWQSIFLLMLLASCQDVKLRQYMVNGQRTYQMKCANCHQSNGKGLGKLYPPLKDSDYLVQEKLENVICQIKNGVQGEMTVNGQVYNHPMPANKDLKLLEIAELVTFVYNTWGDGQGIVTVKKVEQALKSCSISETPSVTE
ncbi:MAG: cytochrome c [Cytophagales bacterium]|nr:cytochrome c [Cytophagales bacterium]